MLNAPSEREPAARLLRLVEELAAEIHAQPSGRRAFTLDSALDRDVGLDSLARVELFARVEREFGVAFSEGLFSEVRTIHDLLLALSVQRPASEPTADPRAPVEPPSPAHATPHGARTLTEALAWHAANYPDRKHITLLGQTGDEDILTYGDLYAEAKAIGGSLQRRGLQPREAVVLMLPTGRDYFRCFMGVLLAGGIPVPVYPPTRQSQLDDHARRYRAILRNCQAAALITVPEGRALALLFKAQTDTLRFIATAAELYPAADGIDIPAIHADDTAFLQYTSGSTGHPKGVLLTHGNLLANIRAAGAALRVQTGDVFVSWLPLYHDMGLIGAWFGTLYHATPLIIMSPLSFLARPQRWLWAIHRYRGTLSAAPNFAYDLCARRIADADLDGMDLGSWRTALNGAESVNAATLRRFNARFSRYGFRPETMAPVYGLAEASLALTMPPVDRGPLIDRIDRKAFAERGIAIPAAETDPAAIEFVACGQPISGHEVRIADEGGRELPDRHQGHLQFRGPSATRGYYRNADATRDLIKGEWLDPGDLAYVAQGDIYITGRTKDLVIRAGRNIHPHELEDAIGHIHGVRKDRIAVFGSPDPQTGTERLIVVAESRESRPDKREQILARINEIATDLAGGPPDTVVLAPPGTVLRTSSGKIRRSASRDLYPLIRRLGKALRGHAYGVYAWTVIGLITPVVWMAVVLLPRLEWRWGAASTAARFLARAVLIPCTLKGVENLPPVDQPTVFIANHASYLDSYFLVGYLPRIPSFVAKAELARQFTARLFLSRLATEFVERFDKEKGLADARRIAGALRAGDSLLFFPEGTFSRVPGLLPFHMGAFIAAAETATPVVPIAIQGTRNILRAGNWVPSRGKVTITIGPAIDTGARAAASGHGLWKTALELRAAAREFIQAHCHEPDLRGCE
ncbi:MAG: Long-chain-fatty-acid--AMP ligase FadD26 [Chromatiales bacterium USCg_Taylor]|nr:MAG: Long-chain-fatty-acid--AMP ligase FadD26 [Chromatiales bacterium USCg_Taylor]